MVGAALAVSSVAASCSGSGGDDGARPLPVGDPVDLSAPGFHELPEPPIAERSTYRSHLVTVWTGEELIVIGTICESPLPPFGDGPAPSCGSGPAAAAYDPQSRSWRDLPPLPLVVTAPDTQALINQGRALGGDGGAQFLVGPQAEVVAWSRDTASWTSVPSPTPLPLDLAVCVDQSVPQFVVSERLGYPRVPGIVQKLEVGADAWSDPLGMNAVLANQFSCGDGLIATERDDLLDAEGAGGYLIEASTGRRETIDPPAALPAFASPWLVGPWLFASWEQRPTDDSVSRIPAATDEVRLVDGGAPVPLDPPDGFRSVADPVLLPGIGVVSEVHDPESGFALVLWRAPLGLVP